MKEGREGGREGERTAFHVLEDDMEMVLGPNRVHVLDDVRVLQLPQQKDFRLDGGQVLAVDFPKLQPFHGHEVARF
jgi:hypothetical protein